jgi:uncharacterized protein YbjT (DUF2867 family)
MSQHRCLAVTGATGFTGRATLPRLRRCYPTAEIRALVRPSSARDVLEAEGVIPVVGDLGDAATLDQLLDGADTLVNIASLGFEWVDPLMDAVRRARSLRRGVFVSTTAILTSLPVRSKPRRLHGERRVKESGLAWTILRPTMIYGTPDDRNIIRLIRLVDRSPLVPVMAPEALQQPVHVEDVAAAIVAAIDTPATFGHAYEVSGAEPIPFRRLVEETAGALGRRRLVFAVPLWPVRLVLRLYNHLSRRPRLTVEQLDRIQEDKAFPWDAARDAFGYAPRPFSEGVRQEVKLYRRGAGR